MSTELFKEAIIEARKLKEIAELDARNKVIEAVTPIIKRMIAKESAAETDRFLFGEDDLPMEDPSVVPPLPGSQAPQVPPSPAMPSPVPSPTADPLSMTQGPPGGAPPVVASPPGPPAAPSSSSMPSDMGSGDLGPVDMAPPPSGPTDAAAPPISPAGDLMGMPMPDDEGKITIDFSQLFSMPTEPTPPGGASAIGGLPPDDDGMPGMASTGEPPLPPPPIDPSVPETGLPGLEGRGLEGGTPGGGVEEDELTPEPVITGEGKFFGFQNQVRMVAEKIDYLYFRGGVPSLVKETIKSQLFTLCEQLDVFTQEGAIPAKRARIAENKLNFLFMKLNEAEESNSYKVEKGAQMTSLKEFAAKLFEEDALGPPTADKATAHAEKVSGVQPGVDLFKEGEEPEEEETPLEEGAPASTAFGDGHLEGDAENKNPPVHDPKALAKKPGAGIVESAPASTSFGDGQTEPGAENVTQAVHDPAALADERGANAILEFDEKELKEAVAKLRRENLSRKLKAVRESAAARLKGSPLGKEDGAEGGLTVPRPKEGDQGSAKPVGGKDPAQKKLAEDLALGGEDAGGSSMSAGGSAGGGGMSEGEDDMSPEEVELTFSIDVDDLEALLSGSADTFVAEPTGEVSGVEDSSVGADDGDIEIVDDTGSSSGVEGLLLDTEEEEEEIEEAAADTYSGHPVDDVDGDLFANQPGASKPKPIGFAKPGSQKPSQPVRESKGRQVVKSLIKQLNEQKLLTAKALYVSKFSVREDLTTKQKQKIAEYFDKTVSLAEAKETYNKIKKILAENTSRPTKVSGSGSRPTSTGSATLTESTVPGTGDAIETARWRLLAGIKEKK